MLSPYSLSRPGGVQGQVHRARPLAACDGPPGDGDRARGRGRGACPAAAGEHIVVGTADRAPSNGSVAPVALWPRTVARIERVVRKGGFDVLHVHEPLAPMAAYGLVLTDPVPMVGTYHRAGVSRWVPVVKPLAELVGRRMQVRVAVSEAARPDGGAVERRRRSRCCSTASTSRGSRIGRSDPRRAGTPDGALPGPARTAQGSQRLARRVRHDGAASGAVDLGRRTGGRGPATAAPRVGPGALARAR